MLHFLTFKYKSTYKIFELNLDKSSSKIFNQFKLFHHPKVGWFKENLRNENLVIGKY